jgi:hypothetical protein
MYVNMFVQNVLGFRFESFPIKKDQPKYFTFSTIIKNLIKTQVLE